MWRFLYENTSVLNRQMYHSKSPPPVVLLSYHHSLGTSSSCSLCGCLYSFFFLLWSFSYSPSCSPGSLSERKGLCLLLRYQKYSFFLFVGFLETPSHPPTPRDHEPNIKVAPTHYYLTTTSGHWPKRPPRDRNGGVDKSVKSPSPVVSPLGVFRQQDVNSVT